MQPSKSARRAGSIVFGEVLLCDEIMCIQDLPGLGSLLLR
jgi:hypothetical protein